MRKKELAAENGRLSEEADRLWIDLRAARAERDALAARVTDLENELKQATTPVVNNAVVKAPRKRATKTTTPTTKKRPAKTPTR